MHLDCRWPRFLRLLDTATRASSRRKPPPKSANGSSRDSSEKKEVYGGRTRFLPGKAEYGVLLRVGRATRRGWRSWTEVRPSRAVSASRIAKYVAGGRSSYWPLVAEWLGQRQEGRSRRRLVLVTRSIIHNSLFERELQRVSVRDRMSLRASVPTSVRSRSAVPTTAMWHIEQR